MENFENAGVPYADPNAFVQMQKKPPTKKVVFSEPYECLPNYYPNNDFKKEKCDCVPKPKFGDKKNNCSKEHNISAKKSGFDLKSLLPILSLLGGGGGMDVGKMASILSGEQNPLNLISSLMQNGGGLNSIFKMFQPRVKQPVNNIKSTDFEITNYTRVE